MQKFAALIFSSLMCTAGYAQPTLIGVWKSDAELTMRFNSERAQLDEKKRRFLSQLMGRLTITFTAKSVALEMPDWEVEANDGKKSPFTGFKEVHPYKMLGHTNASIAVLSREPVSGVESITVYNFDDENTMWVDTGGAGKAFPSEHLREYFVRIR
jgi:hypothetical protein